MRKDLAHQEPLNEAELRLLVSAANKQTLDALVANGTISRRPRIEYLALYAVAILSWLTKIGAIIALPSLIIYGIISKDSFFSILCSILGAWLLLFLLNRGLLHLEFTIDSEKRIVWR